MDAEQDLPAEVRQELQAAGDVPAPDECVFDAAIQQLRTAITDEPPAGLPATMLRRRWRRTGILGVASVAVVAVAAVVAAMLIAPTVEIGDNPPLQIANAREFLQQAAATVADSSPPPGRYWHVRYRLSTLRQIDAGTEPADDVVVDEWRRPNGSRLLSTGQERLRPVCARTDTHDCVQSPLTPQPDAMALTTAALVLAGPPLRDEKLQTLFEIVTEDSSVKLLGGHSDSAGRPGTLLEQRDSSGIVTRLIVGSDGRPLQLTTIKTSSGQTADTGTVVRRLTFLVFDASASLPVR